MSIEIIVPRLGWSMEEGAFVAWLKQEGEMVRAGDPLFSLEGGKAVQEVESIDSGILRIAPDAPRPGQSVRVGDLLGHLVTVAESVPTTKPAATAKTSPIAAPPAISAISMPGSPTPSASAKTATSAPTGKPAISPRALRVAAELGVDWTRLTASGKSGRIRERDVRAATGSAPAGGPSTRAHPVVDPTDREPVFLVTGGCGFIGTWVIRELLRRDIGVVVIDAGDRPARWQRIIGNQAARIPLIRGSLLDRPLLARVLADHSVTHVIHLAALLTPPCQTDPWEGCRVNVLGSVALFEALRRCALPIRGFSYASSVAVFGDEPDHADGAQGTGRHPLTFYGAFKKSMELIAAQYWRHFQLASIGIRPQVAYGPERDVGLTAGPSLAAKAAVNGDSYTIQYTGCVGYDYVEDVARAFIRGAMDTPAGAHVVDLAGEIAEVAEVVAAIEKRVPSAAGKLSFHGAPIPAQTPANPHFISALYPDWETTSLADGIRKTVEFYQGSPPSS